EGPAEGRCGPPARRQHVSSLHRCCSTADGGRGIRARVAMVRRARADGRGDGDHRCLDRSRDQAAEAQEERGLITFDTGVLISLERREKRTWERFRRLRERGVPILVPASCESEWWRS